MYVQAIVNFLKGSTEEFVTVKRKRRCLELGGIFYISIILKGYEDLQIGFHDK